MAGRVEVWTFGRCHDFVDVESVRVVDGSLYVLYAGDRLRRFAAGTWDVKTDLDVEYSE